MGKKSTIMYNQCLEADEILKEYGDDDNLRLDHILDPDEMEDEITCINPSPYYDTSKLPTFLRDEGHFNVLSLNAQSINAKFDGLLLLLEFAYCKLSAKSLSSSAGILHTNLSDHYPYFLSLRLHNVTSKKDFYVKK